MVFHLILWSSLLAYLVGAAFTCRTVLVRSYRNRDTTGRYPLYMTNNGIYGMVQSNAGGDDRFLGALALTGTALIWPLVAPYLIFSGVASRWLLSPIYKEQQREEEREQDLKFWKNLARDSDASAQERETAKMILKHIDPERARR